MVVDPAEPRGSAETEETETEKERVRHLTARVEEALNGVTLSFDSWRQAELLHCVAEVYSRDVVAAPRRARLSARFDLERAFLSGYRALEKRHPEAVEPVLAATRSYDRMLRRLRLEDRHVAATYPGVLVLRFLLRHLLALTVWPPLFVVGLALNWLPYKIPGWVTRSLALEPDVRATWKVLLSVVLFPAYWLLLAALVTWRFEGGWGLATFIAAPISGYLALLYFERWAALRDESAAYLTLKGRRRVAAELIAKRRRVLGEVERLIHLYERSFGTPPRVVTQ
jgi:hypothetical protein